MNENKKEINEDEMRSEYNLSQLKGKIGGKYVERYRKGTNLLILKRIYRRPKEGDSPRT
jgi:hypothetical protein